MLSRSVIVGVALVAMCVTAFVLTSCGGGGGTSSDAGTTTWPQSVTGDGASSYSINTPPQFVVKAFQGGTLGLYTSEQTYTAGIPATVGINIRPIPAGLTLHEVAQDFISQSAGESVWTQNIASTEYVVRNEIIDANMEIVVFTTQISDAKYLEIVAPIKYANSEEFLTMLSSLRIDA